MAGEARGKLWIAYYARGRRWSGRPHDLPGCYRADGWEETAARRIATPGGAALWSRDFAREDASIRVVHWVQHPGVLPGATLLDRLRSGSGTRRDVASVYWEFPAAAAPPDASFASASQALIDELERLWR